MQSNGIVRRIAALIVALLLSIAAPALAVAPDDPLIGCWAYPHDPEKTVLTLNADGAAVFGSTGYTWDRAEEGLRLTGSDGSDAVLKCLLTDTGMTIWLPTIFERKAGTAGLIGAWEAVGTSMSSFSFATNGQFLEDGVFTGDYTVDEEKGQITLKYMGNFQDTVIDFAFVDEYLVVSYPWAMIRQ